MVSASAWIGARDPCIASPSARVDQPVAIDEPLVGEGRRHDGRRKVVAAAGRVDDAHLSVGERDLDAGSDVFGRHGRCLPAYIARSAIMAAG